MGELVVRAQWRIVVVAGVLCNITNCRDFSVGTSSDHVGGSNAGGATTAGRAERTEGAFVGKQRTVFPTVTGVSGFSSAGADGFGGAGESGFGAAGESGFGAAGAGGFGAAGAGGFGGAGAGGAGGAGAGGAGAGGAGGAAGVGGLAGGCNAPLHWIDVQEAPPSGRAISPRQLVHAVGLVKNVAQQPTGVGVLVSGDVGMSLGCSVDFGDTAYFDHALGSDGSVQPYQYPVLGGEPHINMSFVQFQQNNEVRFAAMKRRRPVPGEPARLIRLASDGSAQFAEVELDPNTFDRTLPGAWKPSETTVVFGSDAQLLGFCAYDPCQGLRECITLVELQSYWWLLPPLLSLGSTAYWGDLDADGHADVITLNRGYVDARISSATGLGSIIGSCGGGCYDLLNVFGDVTGDHQADIVTVGSTIRTFVASNNQFDNKNLITIPGDFSKSEQAILADVDGDGTLELALMQPGGELVVVFSVASSNPHGESWLTNAPPGYLSFQLADVNGDHAADAIFGFADHVAVMLSNGHGFEPAVNWLEGVHVVPPGWFFADVNGDGRADAVRLDLGGSAVFPSQGSAFVAAPVPWRSVPLGERGNTFTDVDGDGKADLIIHNDWGIRMARSTGTDFADPVYLTYDEVTSGY